MLLPQWCSSYLPLVLLAILMRVQATNLCQRMLYGKQWAEFFSEKQWVGVIWYLGISLETVLISLSC